MEVIVFNVFDLFIVIEYIEHKKSTEKQKVRDSNSINNK